VSDGTFVTAVLWGSALLDAAALLTLVSRRRVLAAVVVSNAVVVKLIVIGSLGAASFGLLHVVYLGLVVTLPVVGLGLLVTRRGRRRVRVVLLALALLVPAPVGVYASFVEPMRLRVERTTVPLPTDRAGDRDVRIAVLADIQTADVGDYEWRAIERTNDLWPHVVVIPGDLFQMSTARQRRELPELRALVRELRAPGGVYVVEGDSDDPHELRKVLRGTGARLLVNEVVTTRVADRRVTIGGIELGWRTPGASRVCRELETRPGRDDVRILLAHRPDAVFPLPDDPRTDLVIAGHTHGGQVAVPGYGPPITLTGVPRDVGAGGLHTMSGGRRIYVSRGVGHEHGGHAPRLRLFCPPELSLLTLRG
jgi:uncharacterized protein